MFKELIDVTLDRLKEAPFIFAATEDDNAKRVERGEFGKKTLPNAPACLLLHDFGTPTDLEDGADRKIPTFEITCFIIGSKERSQIEAENVTLALFEKAEDRLTSDDILVKRLDGAEELNRWEFVNSEWVERKQTGSIIAATFKMALWK